MQGSYTSVFTAQDLQRRRPRPPFNALRLEATSTTGSSSGSTAPSPPAQTSREQNAATTAPPPAPSRTSPSALQPARRPAPRRHERHRRAVLQRSIGRSADAFFDGRLIATARGGQPHARPAQQRLRRQRRPADAPGRRTRPTSPRRRRRDRDGARSPTPTASPAPRCATSSSTPGNYIDIDDPAYQTNWTTRRHARRRHRRRRDAGDGIYSAAVARRRSTAPPPDPLPHQHRTDTRGARSPLPTPTTRCPTSPTSSTTACPPGPAPPSPASPRRHLLRRRA